jgi:O-methyltransferase
MNLLKIIKNNLFIQNFVANIVSLIPPYLEFTIGKYTAIKKAFYITAHDSTLGCYLEFGVFTGSSFNFAMKVNKKIDKLFGKSDCEFFGFDSFSGFGEISENDRNPSFQDNIFSVNEKKVLKNIKKFSKGQESRIIKGFYKDTIKDKTTSDLNIGKARVVMIDCDLKESAKLALEFIKPSIQEGTIILFDDYVFFKGSKEKGEYGAFSDFKKKYPEILFRRAYDYGYGSRAFIAHKVK